MEVFLLSTQSLSRLPSVFNNLDREKYNVISIGINKDTGEWMYYGDKVFYTEKGSIDSLNLRMMIGILVI